jgi:hypothetical protein
MLRDSRQWAGTHVMNTDENTGIQALERLHATKPVRPGLVERIEFWVRFLEPTRVG